MTTSGVTSSSGSSNQVQSTSKALNANDFIKMMITQLQNQDPMEPSKSQDLLAQMSQIGQLQSSTQLQSSLTSMMMQSQIGAASNLIGKQVQGMDDNNETVTGTVTAVKVQSDKVLLTLDGGSDLALGRVTGITQAAAAAATATAGTGV